MPCLLQVETNPPEQNTKAQKARLDPVLFQSGALRAHDPVLPCYFAVDYWAEGYDTVSNQMRAYDVNETRPTICKLSLVQLSKLWGAGSSILVSVGHRPLG